MIYLYIMENKIETNNNIENQLKEELKEELKEIDKDETSENGEYK